MNRKRVAIVAVVVVAAAAVVAWLVLRGRGESGALYSGTVEAREADLGFQAAGRVDRIFVDEGDAVAAGAVVAVMDTAELSARRAGAAAQATAARAQLTELERGARPEEIGQARASVAAARERLENARRDVERLTPLQSAGVVSRQDLDRARTAAEVAEAQYDAASQQLRLVRTGPRAERIEAQRAVVRQADAVVAQLDAALATAVIRAPFAGVVTIRHREPGETLSPGLPVVTLMNPSDRWVRIYVPEDRVGRVKLGEAARIATDAYPDRRYPGRVTFIASQAEFTPKNVQTTEERTKLVYAVKVAIAGDPARDLKPGIPADVTLDAP